MQRSKGVEMSLEYCEVDVEVIRETDAAILCDVGNDEPVWIPKSQISDESEVYKAGQAGTLLVAEWLALDKRMI